MYMGRALVLTCFLALGAGEGLAIDTGKPSTSALEASARSSVPTGDPQSQRDAKDEMKENSPPPPPRVRHEAVPLPTAPAIPVTSPVPSGL